jgi:hypothetical protein
MIEQDNSTSMNAMITGSDDRVWPTWLSEVDKRAKIQKLDHGLVLPHLNGLQKRHTNLAA